jgi:hypothetical protein
MIKFDKTSGWVELACGACSQEAGGIVNNVRSYWLV